MELREERNESVGQYFLVDADWSFLASGFFPWTDPWPVFFAFSVPVFFAFSMPFFHNGYSGCHLSAG